ncbi:MAG: hypothetical protein JWQ76_543 [Ramlibacter sp.]|nr:hypothetical protein [Ramlibacter sp.]
MIASASLAQSQGARCERASATFHGAVVPLLGAHPVPDAEWPHGVEVPQAFLVQQAPGWVLGTHYHTEHQFQLVTAGAGTMGSHALRPITLHYASPEAGYGPIVAGDQGLQYYTLRARGTRDTWYLPKERERMRHGVAKKHAYGDRVDVSDALALEARVERAVERLMDGADGLGAWMVRLPAGEAVDSEGVPWDGVRFYYLAAGSAGWQGRQLQPGDVSSAQGSDDRFEAHAGSGGAEFVVMQFPRGADLARA